MKGRLRIEDALNATRAAVEEGIVGRRRHRLCQRHRLRGEGAERDRGRREDRCASSLPSALTEPISQIATNAGIDGSVVLENEKADKVGYGFDAYNETYRT